MTATPLRAEGMETPESLSRKLGWATYDDIAAAIRRRDEAWAARVDAAERERDRLIAAARCFDCAPAVDAALARATAAEGQAQAPRAERDEPRRMLDAAKPVIGELVAGQGNAPRYGAPAVGLMAEGDDPLPSGYLIAASIRGDVNHARKPGTRVALCGEENVSPVDETWFRDSYACKRCLRRYEAAHGDAPATPAPPAAQADADALRELLREAQNSLVIGADLDARIDAALASGPAALSPPDGRSEDGKERGDG